MNAEVSVSNYMSNAVKHYSSLFNLPSYEKIVGFQLLCCLANGFLSSALLFPSWNLPASFLLWLSAFLATLLSDKFISMASLKRHPIYNPRRISALSLFSWLIWIAFISASIPLVLLFSVIQKYPLKTWLLHYIMEHNRTRRHNGQRKSAKTPTTLRIVPNLLELRRRIAAGNTSPY